MKIVGLDDKIYTLGLKESNVSDANRSKLHLRARQIIKDVFPFDVVYEEISLPGTNNKRHGTLRADFFIPLRSIMVEVQGEQHYEYISFFHKNKYDMYLARAKDNRKRAWCEKNNIAIIYFKFDEKDDEWKRKLVER